MVAPVRPAGGKRWPAGTAAQYKAQYTYQQSGEDWENVQLTLSTGKPMSTARKPVLNTWWLREHVIVVTGGAPRGRMQKNGYGKNRRFCWMTPGSTAVPYPPKYRKFKLTTSTTTFAFRINAPYDIPSDGQQYVVVSARERRCRHPMSIMPRRALNPHAFLTANVTGWEQYRLLSAALPTSSSKAPTWARACSMPTSPPIRSPSPWASTKASSSPARRKNSLPTSSSSATKDRNHRLGDRAAEQQAAGSKQHRRRRPVPRLHYRRDRSGTLPHKGARSG
ncbi:MAG: DUF4139 domain-containing protein [Lewinellaceae bacterium]|nr:DUF4139 domain-containing protein [Lewinellaceae bacterium]